MTERSRDLTFRIGTGAVALVVVLIVFAIGVELTRQSLPSIQKFGFSFWRTQIWDPVAGEFGALPFIWGTLYSSILALILARPVGGVAFARAGHDARRRARARRDARAGRVQRGASGGASRDRHGGRSRARAD